MTLARVLCGECGGTILATDSSCPHCGAAVELPRDPAMVVCPRCGHRQREGDGSCGSCGAALSPKGAAPSQKNPRDARRRSRPRAEAPGTTRGAGSTRMWQLLSVVAVVVVLGVLAWSELPRKTSEPPSPAAQPAQIPPAADLAPLEREVAENPGDVHAKLRLANALQDNGAYSRAIELYKNYLGVHPEDPDARVDLGICYFELARTDSIHGGAFLDLAIKEMTTAFEGTQQHQPAAFNLGIVYLTAGNLEESTRWFERAAALDSSSALGRRSRQLLEQHRMMSQ